MAILVDCERVTVSGTDRPLFAELSLSIRDGERLGVVGINGTGKSTLLDLLAGVRAPDAGLVRRGRGTRVSYLSQNPVLEVGTVGQALGGSWTASAAADRLGLSALVGRATHELSGGQAKRLALAQALSVEAELLILDEPTNHLDLGGVAWLEDYLTATRQGIVLVTHDRHLLDRLCTKVLELDRGRGYLHDGGYGGYLEGRARREAAAERAEQTRQNLARKELAWLRRGAPARTSKPRAHLERATALVEARPQAAARSDALGLELGAPRLGRKVIELHEVSVSRDAHQVLTGVNLALHPRERLGILGPNGSGKSTLLDVLAGVQLPSSGERRVGETVVLGYADQHGAVLPSEQRVREVVAGPTRPPGSPEDRALLERFWLGGDLAFAKVAELSGGERRRLQLLVVLGQRPNVLLLDEPTNDLDLDTLRLLEDFLEEWPGTVVLVSHDRAFLDRSCDRLLAIGDGAVGGVAGGVAGYLSGLAAAKARPGESTSPARGPRPSDAPAGKTTGAPVNRRLRELDKEIARLERQRDALGAEVEALSDHQAQRALGQELRAVLDALRVAEEAWLELAESLEP